LKNKAAFLNYVAEREGFAKNIRVFILHRFKENIEKGRPPMLVKLFKSVPDPQNSKSRITLFGHRSTPVE